MDSSVSFAFGEGGGTYGETSVTPGLVLGPEWYRIGVREPETARGSVVMEHVDERGGGWVMEGFVCENENFDLNPLWDRKPAKFLEDRSDVITGAGVREQVHSRCIGVYLGL